MKLCILWDPISLAIWDPIECTTSFYLDIVLFWPDDGFLQPKYVAKILKYFQFPDIYIYTYIYVGGLINFASTVIFLFTLDISG